MKHLSTTSVSVCQSPVLLSATRVEDVEDKHIGFKQGGTAELCDDAAGHAPAQQRIQLCATARAFLRAQAQQAPRLQAHAAGSAKPRIILLCTPSQLPECLFVATWEPRVHKLKASFSPTSTESSTALLPAESAVQTLAGPRHPKACEELGTALEGEFFRH